MIDDYEHTDDRLLYTASNVGEEDVLTFMCECQDDCSNVVNCNCLVSSGGKRNYDSNGKFIPGKEEPIFECKGKINSVKIYDDKQPYFSRN